MSDPAERASEPTAADLARRVAALEAELAEVRAAAGASDLSPRSASAWLRGIADAMPVLISYVDADQRFRFANKAYERRFGRSRESIVGSTVRDVMGPDVYAARRPYVERALAGEAVDYEADFPGPEGLMRTRVEHIPNISRSGRVQGFYTLVQDVTEARRQERALRESEERFRRIADSAPVPMWVTGLDRKRTFANVAYCEFLGVPYEAALTFDWRHVLHPDDLPRIFAEQQAKEASLKPFTLEARYRRADGEWRWLRSDSQPRWDQDGGHAGFIGLAFDITASRQAQADLQRINELLEARVSERTAELQALYDKAPVPLHSQDRNGVLISVSDRWLEFMGYEGREQVIGRRGAEFMTDATRERYVADHWPRLLRDGFADDVPYELIRRTGEVAEVLISSRIARDADGRFDRTMGAVVDVTERNRAEAQLRQAQKMDAIGQLTGGVAHDFNNLLTPIIGGLELVKGRLKDDPRAIRAVDGGLQAADRAATLVQRLLAFSRQQRLQPKPTDIRGLVVGMQDLIQSSLTPDIALVVEAAEDVSCAMVDPNQLELALLNLAVNARDAMPDGGRLTVEVSGRRVAAGEVRDLPAGEYVQLRVGDSGLGMDAATLARAVEPFYTTKPLGRGTGLGLSMVHGLAGQSGGALVLISTPGEGTCAELYLPAAEAVEEARTPGAAPARADGTTILLVDDEELPRMALGEMLRAMGCVVEEASRGEDALERLKGRRDIDVLVTDHLMPGLKGGDLARLAVEACPGLPVLLVTGFAGAGEFDAALPRLSKPVRAADLAREINRLRNDAKATPK